MPDYDTKGRNRKRARKGGGGGGGGGGSAKAVKAGPKSDELVDKQPEAGNAAVAELLKTEKDKQADAATQADTRLPDSYRWRLLSDSDLQQLAATIFSECTPSREVTDEMLAVGTVALNQAEHMRKNPDDQGMFGGSTLQSVVEDKGMFPNAGQSRSGAFLGAARFGSALGSSEDVAAAKAAVDAATRIMLSGNPFQKDYVAFSLEGRSPLPDKTDPMSATKIGKFYFFAMPSSETAAEKEEKEEKAANPAAMLLNAGGAEPLV